MNPDFNPDANPFEAILSQMGGGTASAGAVPGAPAPGGPTGPDAYAGTQPPAPGMAPGVPLPQPQEPSVYPGANPGGSKHLVSALQSVQKFISESTDQNEIQAARLLTQILTKLIESDQEKQSQNDTTGGNPPNGPGSQFNPGAYEPDAGAVPEGPPPGPPPGPPLPGA